MSLPVKIDFQGLLKAVEGLNEPGSMQNEKQAKNNNK